MSYGVALRNGVPFTLGTIAALCVNATTQWNPLRLWPDGIATPGMWISPRTLTSEWQGYNGLTPVVTPGTVADTSNPVGLALDIRAGATVLTDPGNHMLQSTSAARPLMSARVNLLTFTEDFSNAVWGKSDVTITGNTAVAPDGVTTADSATVGTTSTQKFIREVASRPGGFLTKSCYLKQAVGQRYMSMTLYDSAYKGCVFDLQGGVVTLSTDATGSMESVGNGWFRCAITVSVAAGTIYDDILFSDAADHLAPAYTGNGTDTVYLWGAQLEYGDALSFYQSVPGDGSTYATDFPVAQKYDGVDDGMATAAFTAGTLTSAMDCMIAVRRDSAATLQLVGAWDGQYPNWFGATESGASSVCYGVVGTPTVWVDGVQLTGGTTVTRDTLNTALTAGDWHILEFRDLDLSTWIKFSFGNYVGAMFPGVRGDILLFPSTASTEDKDAARQWLADYYGVTLP